MADWVGVFFWGGGGGRKGAHSRKYGNWPLYDNDMATGIRKLKMLMDTEACRSPLNSGVTYG